MCGITGIVNLDKSNICIEKEILDFNNSLSHRGPDGSGIFINEDKKVGLGHRRLNILDLSLNGNQPMNYLNNRYWITFNGEIFNYLELKNELIELGYSFKSSTDTEVILASFDKWGENCFNKFNGMWAAAIWDNKIQKLCLSRDRFGEKPLYYRIKNNRLTFASEYKAFKYLNDFNDNEYNYNILNHFQNLENNLNNFIKTAKTLEPGTNLIVKNNQIYFEKWWSIHNYIKANNNSYDDKINEFKNLFKNSCTIRLRSDRKIATSLSGGVDSTTILATLKSLENKSQIPAYSVLFKNSIYDESKYIKELESFYPEKINKIDFSKTNLEPSELSQIIYSNENLDEPHIGPWLIYKKMKEDNYVVSIDGHGPDEMLGGYYDHIKYAIEDQKEIKIKKELINLRKEIFPLDDSQKLNKQINKSKNKKKYLKNILKKIIPLSLRKKFYKKTAFDNIKFKENSFNTLLNKKLYHDFHSFSLPKILNTYDKLSMAHGVEVRSPFLDWRLVTFCFSLKTEDKINLRNNKAILRDYMKTITPEQIYTRKSKIGFVTPPNFFMKDNILNFIKDIMAEKDFLTNDFFNGNLIKKEFYKSTKKLNYNPIKWSEVPFWKYIQTYILYKSFKSND